MNNPEAAPGAVVIDTNIALDLLVFADPAVQALHTALRAGTLRWLATARMRADAQLGGSGMPCVNASKAVSTATAGNPATARRGAMRG